MNIQRIIGQLFIFTLIILSCSASWECISQYGCQQQYARAKLAHPKITNDCSRVSKAGTYNFNDKTFVDCLKTFGFQYPQERDLINCAINKCVSSQLEV